MAKIIQITTDRQDNLLALSDEGEIFLLNHGGGGDWGRFPGPLDPGQKEPDGGRASAARTLTEFAGVSDNIANAVVELMSVARGSYNSQRALAAADGLKKAYDVVEIFCDALRKELHDI